MRGSSLPGVYTLSDIYKKMTDNLNQFAQYNNLSSYSKIFHHDEQHYHPHNRNPLDYYVKRNLELPKYVQGDRAKIFENPNTQPPAQSQKEQPPQGSMKLQVHQYATEIDKLCQYANAFADDVSQRKQLRTVESKPTQQPQEQSEFEQFKQLIKKNMKDLNEGELENEFKQYCEYKQTKSQVMAQPHEKVDNKSQTQNLILRIPDQLDTSVENKRRPELAKKSIRELYQRNNKNVLAVEEVHSKRSFTSNLPGVRKTLTPASLNDLNLHQDEEIQKALQILAGKKK